MKTQLDRIEEKLDLLLLDRNKKRVGSVEVGVGLLVKFFSNRNKARSDEMADLASINNISMVSLRRARKKIPGLEIIRSGSISIWRKNEKVSRFRKKTKYTRKKS